MRNLRKLTAVALAVALVLTSMTAVFAADSTTLANADKAVTLKDLGLYAGQDANDPKVGLENALTTQDSLIFLAKLFGYYETANALTSDQVAESLAKFDDAASISAYAKNVISYSAANGILSGSTKDGKFFVGAKDTVTAERFATFMLRQMGYSVPDYRESVAKLAETKGSKVDATLTGDLTRDDAVSVMYGALTAEKANGKAVIADIVNSNTNLQQKAEKLGLIASNTSPSQTRGSKGSGSGTIQDLKVLSVKALNTKQLAIEFNAQMDKDSAQDESNYIIKDQGDVEKTLTDTSCKLGNDMKTVTITLDSTIQDCLTNSSTAKVIVSTDIMDANKKKLGEEKEVAVEVQDGILPTVKEVKDTGERNIKITFSEPVYEGSNHTTILNPSNFKVTSGTYAYYIQNAELDLDVINLKVGTKLIDGPITVTVNAAGLSGNVIQDYAGYKIFQGEHTFNYVRDTSVPVVTVKEATGKKVVLHFSKPVRGSNIKLYHSEKNNESCMATTETDYADEITFEFSQALPSGTLKLFLVNSKILGEEIIDSYGIRVPDQSLTCEVVIDTSAPVVTDCEVNKNERIKIKFNEALDTEVATNPDSYVVKRLSDNKNIPFTAEINNFNQSVDLIFDVKLDDNTEHQLVVKQFKDLSGNVNKSDYQHNFTTLDFKNPEVINDPEADQHCFAIPEKGKIFIVYSEAMNEAQMLDRANYMVSIDQDKYMVLDYDTITKVDDRIIQIYVKELEDMKDSTIKPSVQIAPIMDLANKRLYGVVDSYLVEKIEAENVHIEEAQLIAKNKIKVVFNKRMKSVHGNDFQLTNLTTPGSINVVDCESITINSDGKTEAFLILDNDLATDVRNEQGELIKIATIAAPSSESESGSKLRSEFYTNLYDKTAPETVKWDHDNDASTDDIAKVIAGGDIASPQVYDNNYTVPQDTTGHITIFFSEDIKATFAEDTFQVAGFTITDLTAPAGTKTVILTVKANADHTPIKTIVTQVSNIYDTADNAFVPSSTWAVTLEN